MITFRTNEAQIPEILFYGFIGRSYYSDEGISDVDFINRLEALGPVGQINIRINSEGGDIKQAWGMYSALNRHPARKVCYIDGLAASCASWMPQACDEVNIAEIGMMMVHLPQGLMMGDASEMRKEAEVLDGMTNSIAGVYASKTGKPVADWVAAMTEETWYTSQDAVDIGLATNIMPNKGSQVNMCHLNLTRFKKVPQPFLNAIENERVKIANANKRRQLEILEKSLSV